MSKEQVAREYVSGGEHGWGFRDKNDCSESKLCFDAFITGWDAGQKQLLREETMEGGLTRLFASNIKLKERAESAEAESRHFLCVVEVKDGDIKRLKAELAAKDAEIAELKEKLKAERNDVLYMDKQFNEAKELIKEMRDALAFYGDPEKWISRNINHWQRANPRIHGDEQVIRGYSHPGTDWVGTVTVGGKLARKTLKENTDKIKALLGEG
jgi:hypothetical protein